MPNNKSALRSYLEYYLTLSNPGYAVLVTGAWGVGKTFQVKKAMADITGEEEKALRPSQLV